MNLANVLTLSRLCLAPVFVVLFLTNQPWAAVAALCLAVVFEVTDLLDGYVARRLGQVSSLGKLIDPLADSVSRFSVFLAFLTEETVRQEPWPVLLVALLFYRDAVVAYVRTFAAATGTVLSARRSGKIKAAVQGCGILVFLTVRAASFLWPSVEGLGLRPVVFYVVMVPIALVTVLSGVDYVAANRRAIAAMAARRS